MNALDPATPSITPEKGPDARDRILSAALSLFAMRGFEGVSTTQIAKVAGITQPLIHYHFKNKEALWKATVTRLFGRFNSEYAVAIGAIPRNDKKRYLMEVIRHYVAFSAKYPEFGQFVMREGAQESERLDWLVTEWMTPLLGQFKEVFQEGVQEGWLKDMPFPQLMMLITASASQFFSLAPLMKALYQVDPETPEQILTHSDAVVEVISAAIVSNAQSTLEPAMSA
ncbi:hypothetical protein A9Q99_01450 [Gammaproteobacteria bacterium 45_16_T64]|nr:hypothetical protein A9Q99_01450 [Gammaproteobacteria bacterium 45_16_T64]